MMKNIDINKLVPVTVTVVTVKMMTIMTNDSYVFGTPNQQSLHITLQWSDFLKTWENSDLRIIIYYNI